MDEDGNPSRSARWSRQKGSSCKPPRPAEIPPTACCEQSFVALLHHRQLHLALLFAHLAAMFEFGGNHMPILDTPEFN